MKLAKQKLATSHADRRLVALWSNPTAGEIKFGHGCTHWLNVERRQIMRKDGRAKRRIKVNGRWWHAPR